MSDEETFEVLYDWEPENPGELKLTKDDKIQVLKSNQYEHGWWFGKTSAGSEGLFPKNYVRKLNTQMPPPPPPRPLPAIIDDETKCRPLSVRTPRKAEDHSFAFESTEAFDSLIATGFSIEITSSSTLPDARPVSAGSRVTLDCKALVWEGAYTIAKPLVETTSAQPLSFTVSANQVAEGLDLAVQRLRQGDTAVVTCVPHLAYGDDGLPPDIPPRVHVIYEICVRDVDPSASASTLPSGPALLLSKAPASVVSKAALEDQFFALQNRSSTRIQVKLATNGASASGASTDDLIKQVSEMGIS